MQPVRKDVTRLANSCSKAITCFLPPFKILNSKFKVHLVDGIAVDCHQLQECIVLLQTQFRSHIHYLMLWYCDTCKTYQNKKDINFWYTWLLLFWWSLALDAQPNYEICAGRNALHKLVVIKICPNNRKFSWTREITWTPWQAGDSTGKPHLDVPHLPVVSEW